MPWVLLLHHGYGVGADGIVQSLTYGRDQILAVLLVVMVDELHQHLGICRALERIALVCELLFQYLVVLDDAVMHQRQLSTHAHMGVGIGCRRLSMGCPARVGYTYVAAAVLVGCQCFQITYFSFSLIHIEVILIANQRHSRAVVSTILQSLQALDEYGEGVRLTYISYYSTHVSICYNYYWFFYGHRSRCHPLSQVTLTSRCQLALISLSSAVCLFILDKSLFGLRILVVCRLLYPVSSALPRPFATAQPMSSLFSAVKVILF